MDFKKILVELDKNISKTYSAESLSTESAMTAIVASNATSLNEEDVKKVEKTLSAAINYEEKLERESGTHDKDGNYVKGSGNFIASYSKRVEDIAKEMGNSFESLVTESAQGSEISLAARTAILVNLGRTNQDEFAEEFFPSILSSIVSTTALIQ